ncbi:hypothetical protein [Owenweeksia hongkongensis]|uniref:hypothetical protein n=1 Tax=Owenweeksia hongkongensis TaxID=253245 RepID=UPI003A95BB6D
MERQLKHKGTLKTYNYQAFTRIGISDIFSAFRDLSQIDPDFLKYNKFNEQVALIKSYRQFYRIAIPTILVLATIGIAINELIKDK